MVKAQAGCSHVAWGRSRWSDQPEFVVVTHWDSVVTLEVFAGTRWPEAVIEPDEEHLLAEVFCGSLRHRRDGLTGRVWRGW
jgi:hypothetical protein